MMLSIALATYNGEQFIRDQLESIRVQSRLPDELVVTDDCSTDLTLSILEEFAAEAPFPVRIERNEQTLGSTRNFEKAIGLCRGEIIALCDQDDVWLPQKLERLDQRFESDSEAALVFTDALLVDERLTPLGLRLWQSVGFSPAMQRRFVGGDQLRLLLSRSFVTGATLAFRRSYRDLASPFPLDVPNHIHDRWLVAVLAAVAKIGFIAEPLILYRQHSAQQLGSKPRPPGDRWRSRLRVYRSEFPDELLAHNLIFQRLLERRSRMTPATRRFFVDKTDHLEARMAIPSPLWRRPGPILRELASGRYHRVSRGLLTAAKDLFL